MVKKLLLLFTVFTLIFSCKNKEEETVKYTYVGGEIVNPKGDYVLFYKDEQFLDSVKLDANNHFIYKGNNL